MFGTAGGGTPKTATLLASRRALGATGMALGALILLTGCFQVAKTPAGHATRTHSPRPSATAFADPDPSTQTPDPTTPDPSASHPATPEPITVAAPAPFLTSVPRGTVVAAGDVASPKGSIHFHYHVVANGNNTYSAQYSGFTSSVPVPISVTFLQSPPRVGDGLTYHGVADHRLGGPTTTAAAGSSVSLGTIGQPSYLATLVTYSSATSAAGIPIELGPNKVLAVNSVYWSVPARKTNVHPLDHGASSYASGAVTAKTSSGAPRRYLVAPGDITSVVAKRFGISVRDLIWLNANLEVFGSQQYLYKGTTLNLDPNSL
jgi:hypothetical protein